MVRIYVASSNPGKLKDFAYAADLAGRVAVLLLPLPGLAAIPPPPENEATFRGNARAKALAYAREAILRHPELAGALLLADDSGLEVDALGGEPGVRSARYADDLGDTASGPVTGAGALSVDARNNRMLLARLGDAPLRTARYRCALTLCRCGAAPEVVAEAEGALEGEILPQPRGAGGFGYDPLFYVPEAGRTMAELEGEQRLGFSHRGRALRHLLERETGVLEQASP